VQKLLERCRQDDGSSHGFPGDLSNMLRGPGGVRLGAAGLLVAYLQGPAVPTSPIFSVAMATHARYDVVPLALFARRALR
jgi:hypothetical protein